MKWIGLICVCGLLALTLWTSAAMAAEVNEWDLPARDLEVASVVVDARGQLWIGGGSAQPGEPEQTFSAFVAQVGEAARINQFPVPGYYVESMAAAPGGGVWAADYEGVQLIGEQGEVTRIAGPSTDLGSSLAAGPEGDIWRTTRLDSVRDSIDRITPSGEVVSFTLPHKESGPDAITPGPDGNLWFTEYFHHRIGRISPSGALSEFPVSGSLLDIVAGPDGNLWFTYYGGVGRITTTGEVSYFPGPSGAISDGPDGRLWLAGNETGRLDRIDPSGRRSSVALHRRQAYPVDLVTGPDGALWYVAQPRGPCNGGGLSCSQQVDYSPAILGRVTVGPLSAGPATATATTTRRRVALPVTCREGRAGEVCRGGLTITARSTGGRRVVLASGTLAQPTDTTRKLTLRLSGAARRMLAHHDRVPAAVTVELEGGAPRTRPLVLVFDAGR